MVNRDRESGDDRLIQAPPIRSLPWLPHEPGLPTTTAPTTSAAASASAQKTTTTTTNLWIYSDGNWAKLQDDITRPPDMAVCDLIKFDVRAVLEAVRDAPQTLGIANVTDEWLDIQSVEDGSLALRVHVSQGGAGGGYVALGTDGSVIRIYAPQH